MDLASLYPTQSHYQNHYGCYGIFIAAQLSKKKTKKKLLHVALGAVNVAVALLKHPLKHIKLDLNIHVYVFLW